MLETLRIATLSFGAVVVGGLLAETAVLLPLLKTFVPANALSAFRYVGPRAYAVYVPCAVIATLSATLTLLLWTSMSSWSRAVLVPALCLQWAGVVTTVVLYLPLQTVLRTADAPPPDYLRILKRTVVTNATRTAMFVVAWVLLVFSVVLD